MKFLCLYMCECKTTVRVSVCSQTHEQRTEGWFNRPHAVLSNVFRLLTGTNRGVYAWLFFSFFLSFFKMVAFSVEQFMFQYKSQAAQYYCYKSFSVRAIFSMSAPLGEGQAQSLLTCLKLWVILARMTFFT